ncbi:Rap1a/Tai family immunity protein [Mesorhizobium sp. A556]
MKPLVAFVAIAMSLPTSASGAYLDGSRLEELCQTNPSFVTGYALALVDEQEFNKMVPVLKYGYVKRRLEICVPEGVTARTIRDMTCNYIATHPGARAKTGAAVVYLALNPFDCIEGVIPNPP